MMSSKYAVRLTNRQQQCPCCCLPELIQTLENLQLVGHDGDQLLLSCSIQLEEKDYITDHGELPVQLFDLQVDLVLALKHLADLPESKKIPTPFHWSAAPYTGPSRPCSLVNHTACRQEPRNAVSLSCLI
ncbi:hypothetical protein EYF80_004313 [Liparis tanakae]|uniref:Uncharacterized protein n=1 Tax=Liparis tanakae TaxID=230148 RepID=A0A4Z2J5V0_9TELE|nr:hypothetical protein EYF80_004313 [Liparis tanakae]